MGGGGGAPQGGPAPRQAGPQMGGPPQGGPDQMQMSQFRQGQYSPQGGVDELQAQFARAQATGASPLVLAELQQKLSIAQRGMEQWQNRKYGEEMGRLTQPQGAGSVGSGGRGGRPAQSQLQQNPYLEMLLRNRLGMGGGGGRGAW